MNLDLRQLYRQMFRSRLFEEAVKRLWEEGKISGEMHLGIGEEAIAAGVVSHLVEGDAMALDHRGTPPLLMRGIDAVSLLRELLGRADGLCGGMGGHMHLFSPAHLAASSGIVGASGPAAVGFAMAAQRLRPGKVSVAFLGEGAVNQGMMMESMNLAAVWKLPLLFVCKNNEWSITTVSEETTAGDLISRANGFGMPAYEIDGNDVEAVWDAAGKAIADARNGQGPSFLYAHCSRPEGHLLGDMLLRLAERPFSLEMGRVLGRQVNSFLRPKGARIGTRTASARAIAALMVRARGSRSAVASDPVARLRQSLSAERHAIEEIQREVTGEIEQILESALVPLI